MFPPPNMSPKVSQTRRKSSAASSPLIIKIEPSSGESNLELSPASSTNSSKTKRKSACKSCRGRKVTCNQGRPRCSRCVESKLTCEYDGQPPVHPEPSEQQILPHLAKSMRGVLRDVEAVLGTSTILVRDELLPISQSHTLTQNAGFVGRSALSAYTLTPSTPTSTGLGLAFSTQKVDPVDCSFTGELPSSLTPVPLIEADANLAHVLVRKYIQYCTSEFRFADPTSLLTAAATQPNSSRVLFACALALLHAPNGAPNAESVFRQAEDALWVEERSDGFGSDIANLEAMMLQLQFLFTARTDVEETWRVAGTCARMVHRLGLHRDPKSYQPHIVFSDEDVVRRRWALHNVALVDGWLALLTGRPTALRNRDHADVQFPVAPANAHDLNHPSWQWRFHIESFAFSHILGDVLADLSSVRALPYHVVLEHDRRIVAWINQLQSKFQGSSFERIELYLFGHHVRAILFAPYTPRYAAASQSPVFSETEASIQARDVVLQSAKAIMAKATEDLGHILRQMSMPAGQLVWAPHHILVAGALLATHSDCEHNVAPDELRKGLEALASLLPAPAAERAYGLVKRLVDCVLSPDSLRGPAIPDIPLPVMMDTGGTDIDFLHHTP